MEHVGENRLKSDVRLSGGSASPGSPVEVVEFEADVTVRVSLPGFAPDQIDVTISGDWLTIEAKRPEPGFISFLRRDLSRVLRRTVYLPHRVDPQRAATFFHDGLLTIRIPFAGASHVATLNHDVTASHDPAEPDPAHELIEELRGRELWSPAEMRSDLELQRDTLLALQGDCRLDATNVQVEAYNGCVVLQGIVPSFGQKSLASEVAQQVVGVERVVNELRVAPPVVRSDADLTSEIQKALARDVWVDETRINVNTVAGVVYLTGSVDSVVARAYAEGDVASVPGVVDIVSQLGILAEVVRADDEVVRTVRLGLDRNQLGEEPIEVSCINGVVVLRGSVGTLEQKFRAEDVARWTTGVHDVENQLTVRSEF